MSIFILEAYRLSTNIEHTLSFYALLWKLIWKRWALCVQVIVVHSLALALSFSDDSDSSGWLFARSTQLL